MTQTTLIGRVLLGVLYTSIAVAILVTAMLAVSPESYQPKVILGKQEVTVTIADTPLLREKGLSGRKALASNEGMLFVFSEPGFHGFWMKDMLFSIDIIWFDQNRRIVDVWERATPASYPKVFTPRVSAQFVLEVPAGFFLDHSLKIGDIVEILK